MATKGYLGQGAIAKIALLIKEVLLGKQDKIEDIDFYSDGESQWETDESSGESTLVGEVENASIGFRALNVDHANKSRVPPTSFSFALMNSKFEVGEEDAGDNAYYIYIGPSQSNQRIPEANGVILDGILDPEQNLDAANKRYVDKLFKSGPQYDLSAIGSISTKDFLCVNLNTPDGPYNKPFVMNVKYKEAINTPPGTFPEGFTIGDNTSIQGIREVFFIRNNSILVKFTELYPIMGKVFYNWYRLSGTTGDWEGWYNTENNLESRISGLESEFGDIGTLLDEINGEVL